MFIQFEKSRLKLDQIQEGEFSTELLAPHEKTVVKHIENWVRGKAFFSFHTSGSTGIPKNIKIPRSKIGYSSLATMKKLDPDKAFKSALLCISPEMIGGAMVVFRSLIYGLDLQVIKPQSKPFQNLPEDVRFDLTSIVPMQLFESSVEELNHFHTILVGGAALGHYENKSSARIYSTFGMTETVSHFALREVRQPFFECIGDIEVISSPDSKLQIKGTLTDHQVLEVNDLIEPITPQKFKWIGRADFIINTGGIKVNPEEVEFKLRPQIESSFFISSLPDSKFGNKLILIVEGKPNSQEIDFSFLEPYKKPKEVYFIEKFQVTKSGKIERIKIQQDLIRKFNKKNA